ncbi:DUF3857 domain-containing protein [Flavobacterium sp.]|uniref:DUF3857 domain-containing protein n=1 Tax=Flavobacterium sp. TaxID=239 RepID=UPI00122398C3|nr:DUF3857 domain-containing protein [Flavobacterium sp.]RZJ69906.1 MAG: DUF3857 domain-containing protein [Flavobacterium sp.]
MRKLLTLLILTVSAVFSQAQKVQLGKVTVAELERKTHQIDSSAVGEVIFSKARTTFAYKAKENRFVAEHEYQLKIKVYKKEGLSLANLEIPYYIGYKELRPEQLRVEEAATYNLVGGKVQKTKVASNAVFKEKVNEYWKTTTIVFPDVKPGSIIEIKYKLKSENIQTFPSFKFQREIPVEYAEYKTEIPVNYQYKAVSQGFFPIKTEEDSKSGSQGYENEYGQTEILNYTARVTTHSTTKLPAIKNEDFVDNPNNYRTAISYELELIQFPDHPVKNFSQTWEGLVQTIYKDSDFGGQLAKSDYYLSQLKSLIAGIESKSERMKKVYAFVQDRMTWNGDNGYYTSDGVEKAWIAQSGNVGEINLMLVSMLNMAGVVSHPVLISTVSHGVASFPNQTAFNYVICAAEVDGKRILLDATNKFATPGILPTKTLNWNGRLVRQNGNSEEISMSTPEMTRSSFSIMCQVATDGSVKGKSRMQFNDLAGLDFRNRFGGMSKDSYLEYLEKYYEGIQIENYVVANEKRSVDAVVESFDFASSKHAEAIGDKIYVDPLLFLGTQSNPFLAEERSMPVFFGYPRQLRYIIKVDLPQGYALESIPESVNITTGQNVVSFKIAAQGQGNSVLISASYESGTMLVNSAFYPNIKDFYTEMVKKQHQKIVFKKV